MATTYRFYRTTKLGTGAVGPVRDCYRSALSRHIVQYVDLPPSEQETFHTWPLDPIETAPGLYSLAIAKPETHAICVADADITPMSPELADAAAVQAWLDQPIGTVSTAMRTMVEADGIPIDGLTAASTRRQFWRRVAKRHHVGTFMLGNKDFTALEFLKSNLATKRSELPANVRTRILNWLTERGLSASWTTPNTTVRELLNYVIDNAALPARFQARFGQLDL